MTLGDFTNDAGFITSTEWTDAGTNIYPAEVTDRVSLGTTSVTNRATLTVSATSSDTTKLISFLNDNGSEVGNYSDGGVLYTNYWYSNDSLSFVEFSADPDYPFSLYTTLNNTSGTEGGFNFSATRSQSGTANSSAFIIDVTSDSGGSGYKRLFETSVDGTEEFVITEAGDVGFGTTTPEAKIDAWGDSSGSIIQLMSNTGTKFMEMLNTGVTTLLGTWDFGGATVTGLPATKTFTASSSAMIQATSTIPLGTAFNAQTWDTIECYTNSGKADIRFGDGTNWMTFISQASTTVGRYSVSSSNTFTAGEKIQVQASTTVNGVIPTCTVSYQDN